MKNFDRNKALSWTISLVVHATGAVLILVAGFHLATPEGTVSDATNVEVVEALKKSVATSVTPREQTPTQDEVVQAPPQTTLPPVKVEPQETSEPPQDQTQENQPVSQSDEEAPAMSDSDTSEEQRNQTPVNVGEEATDNSGRSPQNPSEQIGDITPIPSETPAILGAVAPTASTGEMIPKYGTPGTTLDESKLIEGGENRKPRYPWTSRLRHQQGIVILRAFIGKEGRVQMPIIEQSSGFPLLDQEALQAYSQWKYKPGRSGWVLKPFKFSLKN